MLVSGFYGRNASLGLSHVEHDKGVAPFEAGMILHGKDEADDAQAERQEAEQIEPEGRVVYGHGSVVISFFNEFFAVSRHGVLSFQQI